jgi:hypothetical protein
MVWPEDVPPEVVSQQRAAAKKETKPRKPGLRAVSGEAADRNGESATPSTHRSDALRPTEARRELRGSLSSKDVGRPPRLVQVVSNPTSADSASSGASGSQRSEPPRPEPVPSSSRDDARPPASKRSRPPYLRLVD